MRLRLLVPRGGRGRGLGGLAAAALAAAVLIAVASGRGDAPREPAGPPGEPSSTAPAPLDAPGPAAGLAVGITEPNPNLVAAPGTLAPPPPWDRWRDALARLEPAVYRLPVVWSALQPSPDVPPDLARPETGCMRSRPPCAEYAGVRAQMRALASRQREGGWAGMVVFTSTPDWAAGPVGGCARNLRTGAPRPDALPAYRRLVAGVLDVAAQEGARIDYMSPWNEPNHPYFLSPQRTACDPGAPPAAIAPYARIAAALRAELARRPDAPALVLGETAAVVTPQDRAVSVGELVRGLPRELVCSARVWGQHAYVGGRDPVDALAEALAARRCPEPHAIWITETGVGPAPGGLSNAPKIAGDRRGCRLLHERLEAWHADPRVTLAAQYTMREDDLFPTGLVTTDLARERPALRVWQAWGARPEPAAPPPAVAC